MTSDNPDPTHTAVVKETRVLNNFAESFQKSEPGATWKAAEIHVVPKNRLGIVTFALMLSTFLAILDQAVVATALPTVVSELGGASMYGWAGMAYLLGSAALLPVYCKLSDIVGRKPIIYISIVVFIFSSAMCGAAQNMVWFATCRAIQGIGSGAIISLGQIAVTDILPLHRRPRFASLLGMTFGVAGIAGPILGGVLTDHVSWRWCFWSALPAWVLSGLLLFFFLNINPPKKTSFREEVKKFDFIGLFLLVVGFLCLLLGFSNTQSNWASVETIVLILVGVVSLIIAGIYETYTSKSPVLPPRLFKTRTTTIILIAVFIHYFVLYALAYYVPLYYQVLGSSATKSGYQLIPLSFGFSFSTIISGLLIGRWGYRTVMWVSWALMLVGYGLLTLLSDKSSLAEIEIFPFICSMGSGPILQAPLIGLQAAMPLKDMATSIAAFDFVRTAGGSIGIAVAQAIISSSLKHKIAKLPNLDLASVAALGGGASNLKNIPNVTQQHEIIHAYAESIRMVWIVMTPIAGFGLILIIFLKEYTLKSNYVHATSEKVHSVEDGVVADDEKEKSEVEIEPIEDVAILEASR